MECNIYHKNTRDMDSCVRIQFHFLLYCWDICLRQWISFDFFMQCERFLMAPFQFIYDNNCIFCKKKRACVYIQYINLHTSTNKWHGVVPQLMPQLWRWLVLQEWHRYWKREGFTRSSPNTLWPCSSRPHVNWTTNHSHESAVSLKSQATPCFS